jgi:hypothetical protein
VPNPRLLFALEQLQPSDWRVFENFAAEFNAVDYPSLRTTASASGDKGRDGQLVIPDEESKTMFQYSVAHDWKSKIQDTIATLKANFSGVNRLIYCTNQSIGPAADEMVEGLRKTGYGLDIRDASWFVDREFLHPQREIASQELFERVALPILQARGIADRVAKALPSEDGRVALLHLSLEGIDQGSDKGLTKSSFEALVRSALHDSSAEHPISLADIRQTVHALVPVGDHRQIDAQVDGALSRLTVRNGPVKRVGTTQEFHLSHSESVRLHESTASFLLDEQEMLEELLAAVRSAAPEISTSDAQSCAESLRGALDELLFSRGELFATASLTGDLHLMGAQAVEEALGDLSVGNLSTAELAGIVVDLLESPGRAVGKHLRRLADGYTLYSFLRQTPDVQKVVLKVFQGGDVWLDTNVVLPLIVETLASDDGERPFTDLLRGARDAGVRLYVTGGIVEEILSHLQRSLQFARTISDDWYGQVPFVYAGYALAGLGRNFFVTWLEEFRGSETPSEDIATFLLEFGIELRSLEVEATSADPNLRAAVQEFWLSAHDRRKARRGVEIDPLTALRLANHDVENSLGVIQLRAGSAMGPMGFTSWWLTLDREAYRLEAALASAVEGDPPRSPALSPDFLVELLRLGPMRSALERDLKIRMPVIATIGRFVDVPIQLVELADKIRKDSSGLHERVIARKVRDGVNAARWRLGAVSRLGVGGLGAVMASDPEAIVDLEH